MTATPLYTLERVRQNLGALGNLLALDACRHIAEGHMALYRGDARRADEHFAAAAWCEEHVPMAREADAAWASGSPAAQAIIMGWLMEAEEAST